MAKLQLALIIILLLKQGFGNDDACELQGGICQDYRYNVCYAGYETGLCGGDSNRRCCLECTNTCQSNEVNYQSCCDSGCTAYKGGSCQHDSNYCNGSYYSGKCGGPAERKCCVSLVETENGCYGNVQNVDTTGASHATASQDNLPYNGVSASRTMAQTDLNRMNQYKSQITAAAQTLCVDAAVIAGIISRETRAGALLRPDGFGADGHGYGLMQVDNRYHSLRGGPYSIEHIIQGTEILISMINGVTKKHSSWTQDMSLKGGICAYNCGVSNVQTYENMDVGTTGNDYSNDVVARSQYYKENDY